MLFRLFLVTVCLLSLTVTVSAAEPGAVDGRRVLAVGEARFFATTGDWFAAISRLDSELSRRAGVIAGADPAIMERVDHQLSYRMSTRAGVPLAESIRQFTDEPHRNDQFFRLAQLSLRRGDVVGARYFLDRLKGVVRPETIDDISLFRAQVLIANGRYDEAISVLEELRKSQGMLALAGYNRKAQELLGFAGYNLGIAHLLNNSKPDAYLALDQAGQVKGDAETAQSIRDRANLMLGEQLLLDGSYPQAGAILDRVRLEGPYTNPALLAAGWVAAQQGNFRQALVPWTLLADRAVTDVSVQEALLAVPYSYGKLGVYNQAGTLYGRAVDLFGTEIDKLTASLSSLHSGRFLQMLVRDELQRGDDWLVRLRELPEMPETYYLLDLMGSHPFQESLHNYLDLEQLRRKMVLWQQDLLVFEELIADRRDHYEPLLPSIDAEFKKLEKRIAQRKKQRDDIGQQLREMEITFRPNELATSDEKRVLADIDRIDQKMKSFHVTKTRARIERLRGIVFYDIYSSYDQRLQVTRTNFNRLDEVVTALQKQYDRFVLLRSAATNSYTGYDQVIATLRAQIKATLAATATVMDQQGEELQAMLDAELNRRLDKIKEMQVRARYAMAHSFDQATAGGTQ